jgi:hypothetical protein
MPDNDDSHVSPDERLGVLVNEILTSYLKAKAKEIEDKYKPKSWDEFWGHEGDGI